MASRSEISTLISYVLSDKNRQLMVEAGFDAVPREARILALRGLQDLGWINHCGLADYGESYSLTRDGRRIAFERPELGSLDQRTKDHIVCLRQLDCDSMSSRIEALRKLVEIEYGMGNWDSALVYCYDLKKYATSGNEIPCSAFALFYQGRIEAIQSRWDDALESYLGAMERYMECGDRKGVAMTNRAIGTVYGIKGDHVSAIRCLESSLVTAREIDDRAEASKAEANLAIVYDLEGRYDESERASKNCLSYFLETGDIASAASVANNLGVLMMSRERFQEAAEYFEKIIISGKSPNNEQALGAAFVNAAYCYARIGQTQRSLEYTDKAVGIFKEPNDQNMLALAYRNYGYVELRNSNPHSAFDLFEKSIRAAKASGVEDTLAACYYEYGAALVKTATNPRLAKKLLKRSATIYRGLNNITRALAAESRLSAA